MRKSFIKILAMILVGVGLMSCSTYVSYYGNESILEVDKYNKILKYVSTKQDVLRMFGSPMATEDSFNGERWIYQYEVFTYGNSPRRDLGRKIVNFDFNNKNFITGKASKVEGDIDIVKISKQQNLKLKQIKK